MLAVPTSVVEIIKNFLDVLSNISAELSGYSVYMWMVLVMIMYFCTSVEERKFMVYPVAKFQTLHLSQTSPIGQGRAPVCIPQGLHTQESAQGSSKDLLELLVLVHQVGFCQSHMLL